MEPLQYDPRTKQYIKDTLFSCLYDPVNKQLRERLDTLIIKNTIANGYSHKSFNYRGTTYSKEYTAPPRKMNRLSPLLVPEMDSYIRDISHLSATEIPYVTGYLNQVLNASESIQDYIRLLPAALHRPLDQFMESCPCRHPKLKEEQVFSLQEKNTQAIQYIKQRMVLNLIT